MKNETKLIAAIAVVIALLVFWPRSYGGRFAPRPGTNFALDNKTGESCRIEGERSDVLLREQYRGELDESLRKYRAEGSLPSPVPLEVPKDYALTHPVVPLCSEIVEAEKHKEEAITRFVGMGLLVLFGIYITFRHWRKREG